MRINVNFIESANEDVIVNINWHEVEVKFQ